MTLCDVFCRNFRILLALKGLTVVQLAELCGNDVSLPTLTKFHRSSAQINPTLNGIACIAKALGVKPTVLLDPDLDYNGSIKPCEGYIKRECLLSDVQNVKVEEWEKINRQRIIAIKRQKIEDAVKAERKFKE